MFSGRAFDYVMMESGMYGVKFLRRLQNKRDVMVQMGQTMDGNWTLVVKVVRSQIWHRKQGKWIENKHKVHDLGNGSHGAIDGLCNLFKVSRKYVQKIVI